MVLGDIIDDYTQFVTIIETYSEADGFTDSALQFINEYHERIDNLADVYLKSQKANSDATILTMGLNNLENAFSKQIANMNSAMRRTTRLITEIEQMDWRSDSVSESATELCKELDRLMNLTEIYASNKINGKSNTKTFFYLIEELDTFKEIYTKVYVNHQMLINIENELLEDIPGEDEELSILDVRSYKPDTNLESFTDDLKLLSDCLQHYERLVCDEAGQVIYLRKIESGSLKAVFGSSKVDFSIFPDLITSISNAIQTWRITPAQVRKMDAETEKLRAETRKMDAEAELAVAKVEEQRIKNVQSKLAIVNTQIDFVCDKLGISKENPEQVQKFLLPVVEFLENNPVGTINGTEYDISKEVHLLENK